MYKKILFLSILLILIPASAFSQIAYDSKQKLISVKSEGGLLSILLSEVSAKTGIDIYFNPSMDKKVFVNIKNQPVDEAIKKIIKPLNNAFVYQGKLIKTVKIFQKSESEATTKIRPSASQSIATSTTPSAVRDLTQKAPPTRKELEAQAKERRRKISVSQGKLKEFEEKETIRDGKIAEREAKRVERRDEREKMRADREERRKKLETEGKVPPKTQK